MAKKDSLQEKLQYILEESNRFKSHPQHEITRSEELSIKEEQSFKKGNYEEKNKHLKNERFRWDTISRIGLAIWAAIVVSCWLIFVGNILKNNALSYNLSDKVIIALLGTTTLNVLGLMVIVLKGLFKS